MLARSDASRAIGAKRSAKRAHIASRAARIKKPQRRLRFPHSAAGRRSARHPAQTTPAPCACRSA
ncbi:hypothetical protein DP49_5675 [Burkholderia pseudomallei]|nr:hypothetical protein DP49_5675 [Burkholderia pseudomallei]